MTSTHALPFANPQPRWISALIWGGCALFMLALLVSAVFDPSIRLLHTLQALIYVAAIVLARRRSAWGYGAGFFIAAFWNYINLFVTTFIRGGLRQLGILFDTGQAPRPDLLIALVAASGHFLLIGGCIAGFARSRPNAGAWVKFVAGGVLAVSYFVIIIVTTGRQYIGLLHRVFRV